MRHIAIEPTFEAWQAAARALLREGLTPDDVAWSEPDGPGRVSEPHAARADPPEPSPTVRVPRQFLDLARQVASHRDPTRWTLLYRVLWRLVHESRDLLKAASDPEVRRLHAMAAEARREAHRAEVAELSLAEGAAEGAAPFVPPNASLDDLREAVRRCTGCDLYQHAT